MAKKSNFNVNDLSTWPIVFSVIIVVVIIAILFYLIKMLLVDNISTQIKRKEAEIVKREQQYAKDKKIVALLPEVKKEIAQLEKVRDEAKKYLPTEVSMPSLIDNVYLAARHNSIVFDEFIPQSDIQNEYYIIKPISLKADVGYLSMAAFIEEVTSLRRIMNVDSVSFRSQSASFDTTEREENLPLTMTAQLRTYILKE